jgi:uridine phosphorylase
MEYAAVRKALDKPLALGQIQLMKCGVGEGQSRLFCEKIDSLSLSCLILLGWAGGLVSDLAVGDVICADTALREGQAPLQCQTLPIKDMRTGPILTVPKALLTPAEKQSAQASGAVAVEMEAYPMVAWANARGIQFIHARVILDGLDESLPDLNKELDPSGGMRWIPFIKRLAARPAILQDLWKLNGRVRALDTTLAKLASDVFNAIPDKSSSSSSISGSR